MKMQSSLKVQKSGGYDYLYIYFKQKKNRLLFNTGYKPDKGKMTSENLFKNNDYINAFILKKKNAVDEYINNCRLFKKEVNQRECAEFLQKRNFDKIHVSSVQVSKEKSILQYFKDFVQFKTNELNHYNSIRVYNSLYTTLKKFSTVYQLTFEKVNTQQFFPEFKKFSLLSLNHIDNTISKNVAIIKAFFMYLSNCNIIDPPNCR